MTQRKSRLQQELSIIPLGWTIAAGIAIVAIEVPLQFVVPHFAGPQELPPAPWWDLLGAVAALLLGAVILLTGYVYADAKRRRMNAILWTLLVILIPKPIGFIAYFLLRVPLLAPCPKCGAPVGADFAFCPKCGFAILPSCPGCGRPMRRDYVCCPHCGRAVSATVPQPSSSTP